MSCIFLYFCFAKFVAAVPSTTQLAALNAVCAGLKFPECRCGSSNEVIINCNTDDVIEISSYRKTFHNGGFIDTNIGLLSNLERFNVISNSSRMDSLIGTFPSGRF